LFASPHAPGAPIFFFYFLPYRTYYLAPAISDPTGNGLACASLPPIYHLIFLSPANLVPFSAGAFQQVLLTSLPAASQLQPTI
jgi:hypothetical protein